MPKGPTASEASSNPLADRFPDLYYDVKTVEEKTLKPTPPSIAQIFAKILAVNGMNASVASDLAQAAEAYYKGA